MGFMAPKTPTPQAASAPPKKDDAAVQEAAQRERQRLARLRGGAATIKTSGAGLPANDSNSSVGTKILLGG
jgi:hypothetical protein